MLTDFVSDCKERLKDYIPYIGKSRVPWYCFGDYEKWKDKMSGCAKSCRIQRYCKNRDVSKIVWSPIIIRVTKGCQRRRYMS